MGVLLGTRDSTTTGVIGESDGGESGFMNKRERAARKTTAGEDTRIANKVDAPAPNAGGNNKVNLDLWHAIAKMDDGELRLCFLEMGLVAAGRRLSSSSPWLVWSEKEAQVVGTSTRADAWVLS